jgi:DNA-binding transcriptional MerR regulator
MLRHYEKIGLLPSNRVDDYAYRVYDEDAVRRLQYIIVLRKLRIPLKEISTILKTPEQKRNSCTAN